MWEFFEQIILVVTYSTFDNDTTYFSSFDWWTLDFFRTDIINVL